MTKVHGMMLVRNEANRYLRDVLRQMERLCNTITILDDFSEDNTVDICEEFTNNIYRTTDTMWGTNELLLRQNLWTYTIQNANNNDWILCLDADELFVHEHLFFIDFLFKNTGEDIDAIGFKLHDMWDNTHYREDEYWQAHKHYWPMAIRYKADKNYIWNNKKLHCGRFPQNGASAMYPSMIPLKHYGWSKEEDRIKKYNRYMEIDSEGKNGILAQYKSILDANPNLIEFGRGAIV